MHAKLPSYPSKILIKKVLWPRVTFLVLLFALEIMIVYTAVDGCLAFKGQ